jgi:hypothetical protein
MAAVCSLAGMHGMTHLLHWYWTPLAPTCARLQVAKECFTVAFELSALGAVGDLHRDCALHLVPSSPDNVAGEAIICSSVMVSSMVTGPCWLICCVFAMDQRQVAQPKAHRTAYGGREPQRLNSSRFISACAGRLLRSFRSRREAAAASRLLPQRALPSQALLLHLGCASTNRKTRIAQ